MKLVTILLLAGLACTSVLAFPQVHPKVLKSLEGENSVNILISFKDTDSNLESIRNKVAATSFGSRTDRIEALYNGLKSHADASQAQVLSTLRESKSRSSSTTFEQLWISNQVSVKNANAALIQDLLKLSEISRIEQESFVSPHAPSHRAFLPGQPAAGEQWNVVAVDALDVWAQGFKGEGVVIATIDTGVRGTHEALRDGFRQENGWYDPIEKSQEPNDDIGYGTHLTGIIAGRANGIGVAPEAQWISCKGCSFTCSVSDLIACGQWALCPTDANGAEPRCDLAPAAVNNGWGGGQGQTFYDPVLQAWETAGIIGLFTTGASGPGCGSVASPGDSPLSLTVTALSATDQVSSNAGAGPTTGGIKPNIAAPGLSITSAAATSDTAYQVYSGTGMSSPHVAGVIALLKNKKPTADVAELKSALFKGAQPTTSTGRNCGGIDEDSYPNNHVGYGRVSAKESAALLQ